MAERSGGHWPAYTDEKRLKVRRINYIHLVYNALYKIIFGHALFVSCQNQEDVNVMFQT
jgi:hypothetical protein